MKNVKGIVLAGGAGSRLYPLTFGTSKQLLPVYDKPMIYYPIASLLYAGIKEILIISSPKDLPRYKDLLKDGSHLGINIEYAEQQAPNGIAEAFIIGDKFISKENVCLILGDNIFHGNNFKIYLEDAYKNLHNGLSTIFGYEISNPKEFGVIEVLDNKIINLHEKPEDYISSYAVVGLYIYEYLVFEYIKLLTPSKRGELEITDLNKVFLNKKNIAYSILDSWWIDAGTEERIKTLKELM